VPAWAADALSTNGRLDFPTTLLFSADGRLERVLTDVTTLR
jgi:16S rRNA U516 pseudouridylate synthase RsuA-like enzyme